MDIETLLSKLEGELCKLKEEYMRLVHESQDARVRVNYTTGTGLRNKTFTVCKRMTEIETAIRLIKEFTTEES